MHRLPRCCNEDIRDQAIGKLVLQSLLRRNITAHGRDDRTAKVIRMHEEI
jgi:hypothetical protein